MSRVFLAGLVGIALLFAGSVAFLTWTDRPSGSAPLAGNAPLPPAPAGERAAEESAAPSAPAAPPPRPLSRTPDDLMPPPRRHALVSFRRELIAGLAELQARVARCAPAAGSPTSFMLTVESVASGVRVVEAKPETAVNASEAELACARGALLGHVIRASSAEPGRRWQLRFTPRVSR